MATVKEEMASSVANSSSCWHTDLVWLMVNVNGCTGMPSTTVEMCSHTLDVGLFRNFLLRLLFLNSL